MRRRLLLAALAAPGAARAETPLEAQMRRMAAVRSRRSRFEEERALPELDVPIPYSGTLTWQAPDRLEKHTVSPIEERLVVAGPRLTWERPDRGQRQDFALASQPEMAALVEAVRATLAGDLATLGRHYDIRFDPEADGSWSLRLIPSSLRLRGMVQRLTLRGTGTEVLEVETQEGGGISRMRIFPLP
ncbi:LolA family protein [Sabulicella glaciei]|uniref:Outer membrane lipoprotein carrier protein LolA n=1 Tax=Sabulicella glaciei TaxID=2984948 RepID=A0ABT3NXK3_9PROT|nr:outer membrane lipoprotein carrier protein LolA [Roseococcus sp. MDT2-1-1]